MKEIQLSQGKVALVDDEDFDMLNVFKWSALCTIGKRRLNFYASRMTGGKNSVCVYMHRIIMKPPPEMQVDHIDGNGLNNQKSNLRVVTHRQNQQNLHFKKSSKYPGVCWEKKKKKWMASLQISGKSKTLGCFDTEEEAHQAYVDACNKL